MPAIASVSTRRRASPPAPSAFESGPIMYCHSGIYTQLATGFVNRTQI
jgi:hypothetical protein